MVSNHRRIARCSPSTLSIAERIIFENCPRGSVIFFQQWSEDASEEPSHCPLLYHNVTCPPRFKGPAPPTGFWEHVQGVDIRPAHVHTGQFGPD